MFDIAPRNAAPAGTDSTITIAEDVSGMPGLCAPRFDFGADFEEVIRVGDARLAAWRETARDRWLYDAV